MHEGVDSQRVRKYTGVVFALVLILAALMFALLATHTAHAGSVIGNPGNGGGGGGGANTDYGYGWYKFNTNGAGTGTPGGMKSGSWPNVQAQCAAVGATTITAFIVETSARTVARSVVYTYVDRAHDPSNYYGTYNLYNGNNGGQWQTYGQAQAAFNSLPAPDRAGYTFGANVGYFCSDFRTWDITPSVSVNKSIVTPGDVVTWRHSVRNNGPTTSSGVSYGYSGSGGPFGPIVLANGQVSTSSSTYTIKQSDVGTNVCRATYARPRSGQNGGVIASGSACVSVPYNYALAPSVTIDHTDSASVGTTVNVLPSVINAGPTKSKATDWQVTEFVVTPGNTPPAGGVSANTPCAFYKANVTGCTSPVNGDTGNTVFNGSDVGKVANSKTPLTGTGYTLPDLPVGSRVCFALSVKPNSSSDNNWRHSDPICVVVSKSPIVHILGGDLRVGAAFVGDTATTSQIDTSVTIKTNKSYGSWDEYGLAAAGTISGAASGSAYSGGLACTAVCATSTLSLANTPTVGNFTPTTNIPDVAAAFSVNGSTPLFSSLADATQKRVETANTDITIGGGTIAKGNWLVINAPTHTVTITGDITYDNSPMQSIGDIPQLVIIANQINIEGNVKNVDAWLVASGATGTINTCSAWNGTALAATDPLTSKICSDPLTINGPVMAKKLYLRRSAGADNGAGSDNPGEVINLRPDAYLWGIARVGDSGRLTTVYETELPPRF